MIVFNTRLFYFEKSFLFILKYFLFSNKGGAAARTSGARFPPRTARMVGPVCPECLNTKRKNSIDSQQSKNSAPRAKLLGTRGRPANCVGMLKACFQYFHTWPDGSATRLAVSVRAPDVRAAATNDQN